MISFVSYPLSRFSPTAHFDEHRPPRVNSAPSPPLTVPGTTCLWAPSDSASGSDLDQKPLSQALSADAHQPPSLGQSQRVGMQAPSVMAATKRGNVAEGSAGSKSLSARSLTLGDGQAT